jgi:dGTPase
MKKLENYAMDPHNPLYKQAIKREYDLYKRNDDIRTPFYRDYSRIIFSQAYRRMKHKTQVFFAVDDDHVCTRNEHVNLVESISYTIAKELGLNTELTKAIATGHDIGHAPFGHGGEKILRKLSEAHNLGSFWHEKNSLYLADSLEVLEDDHHHLHNLDLTYAVRDGIISHCGEMREKIIIPRNEIIDLKEYTRPGQYEPWTYEGCVVKISDKIAYLGRDIEDALRLDIIKESQVEALRHKINLIGKKLPAINNGSLVNYFIQDVVHESSEKGIALSEDAFYKMHEIMDFNYHEIYEIKRVKIHTNYVSLIINSIFEFLFDYGKSDDYIEKLKKDEPHYPKLISHYLTWIEKYAVFKGENRDPIYENEIVYDFENDSLALEKSIIDYLAGMTDSFLLASFNELLSF